MRKRPLNVGHIIDFPAWGNNWRVSRCEVDQVLDLAYLRSKLDPDKGHHLTISEHGWYRCNPCLDGEHLYDIDRAPQGQRGAFHAWMVTYQ